MSRVAKNPVEIVDGVTVNVTDKLIEVKGKVGEIKFDLPDTISLEDSEAEDGVISSDVDIELDGSESTEDIDRE